MSPGTGQQPTTPTTPPASGASTPTTPTTPAKPTEIDHTQDIRGNCTIKTDFQDDRACLVAPKAEEGFQFHVGPSDYTNATEVAKFLMKPGQESSECFTFRGTNAEPITYQTWMLSGRSGTHHIINTEYSGELPTGSFGACGGRGSSSGGANAPKQIGALPGASKAYMARGKVAPEFADVGRTISAKTLVQSDMHYFNFTDKDILREYWLNVYSAPAGTIKRKAEGMRGFGGLGWNQMPITPGTDNVYKYECPIKGSGHIMNLIGHYHAHGKRFTASIKRTSGQVDKVFEMFDYLDPAVFDYNTVTQNPTFGTNTSGAVSGILPVSDGDILQWECHIINDGDVDLHYTNEVKTGEMCNLWGFTVDTQPWQCDKP